MSFLLTKGTSELTRHSSEHLTVQVEAGLSDLFGGNKDDDDRKDDDHKKGKLERMKPSEFFETSGAS